MDTSKSIRLPSNELIKELLAVKETPCISLYMPTHRTHPENQKDPISYKNLLKKLEDSLLTTNSKDEVKELLSSFTELIDDKEFWNHTSLGLAIFSAGDLFNIVILNEPINELAVVADSFHTKPLRLNIQSLYRYQVLGLTLHSAKLYEGTRHSLQLVNLAEQFPDDSKQASGSELSEDYLTAAASGGVRGESNAMVHGHGGSSSEIDKDDERYFRLVADAVHERYSKQQKLPLVLAALSEHHNLFQKINKNPNLIKEGIQINPNSVEPDKLAEMAWELLQPEFLNRIETFKENFSFASSKGTGSDILNDVRTAAKEGRVGTLLLEADKIITDESGGRDQVANLLDDSKKDDILDDIGETVHNMGGEVIVIPAELMPSTTGVAAIFRY